MVCDWCGDLFGIHVAGARVSLSAFSLTGTLLPLPTLPPLATHPLYISATPDILVMPVKAPQNQAGQTISGYYASIPN